jgi:membrane protein YqaA with SNARE-associated domain
MTDLAIYASEFLATLIAATIVPLQSEALLVGLVASVGNVLGSVVNWLLGRGIVRFSRPAVFPATRPDPVFLPFVAIAKIGCYLVLAIVTLNVI